MTPKATFLMTAYNSEEYIRESIESVLSQTYKDFTLLIIDDASTDKTSEIILSFDDSRIQYIKNQVNLGTAEAANMGLALIQTLYFLRLDSDDICIPERLEIQLEFMEANPKIEVCGSYIEFFGEKKGVWKMPTEDKLIRSRLIWDNVIANSSVIIRTKILKSNHINYNAMQRKPPLEDYQLWLQLIPFTKFANLPQVLVRKREHVKSQTAINLTHTSDALYKIHQWAFDYFGLPVSDEELKLHLSAKSESIIVTKEYLFSFKKWQEKLQNHFQNLHYMNHEGIKEINNWYWKRLGEAIKLLDIKLLHEYISLSEEGLDLSINLLKQKLRKKL